MCHESLLVWERAGFACQTTAFGPSRAVESDLGSRGDGAGGHPDRVDASIGVLVDSDVGFLPLGLDVPRRVKQVQHLLVVQLEGT